MKNLTFTVIIIYCFALSLDSCTSDSCFEDTDPLVVVELLSKDTGVAMKCDSIKVYGVRDTFDTLLVDEEKVSKISFSLDPLHNEALYYFTINKIVDTVTISYSNYPHMISTACGYTIYSDISGPPITTHHIIDGINVDNKSVTLNGERNLRLFY